MSGLIKLFNLDANNDVYLDKDEVRLHPPLYEIFKRDRGSKGDSDGRLKLQAFKELAFIYYLADIEADCSKFGYTGKEANEKGRVFARLDSDFKPDKLINEAIQYYKDYQKDDPINLILQELKIGLRNNYRIYSQSNEVINLKLQELEEIREGIKSGKELINPAKHKENSDNSETLPVDTFTMLTSNIDSLLKYSKNIYNIISDLPTALDNLQTLENKVKARKNIKKTARGGSVIGKRADPKR